MTKLPISNPDPAAVPATSSFTRTWSTAPYGGFAAPALCGLTTQAAGL
jgi:hypothetical protein